jgi:hypothetical protein
VQYLFNGLAVEVAQHVGVASTAGFDITTGIDMQASPRGGTVEIAHTVFTAVLLAPGLFCFAVIFSGMAIGNESLSNALSVYQDVSQYTATKLIPSIDNDLVLV